MRDQDWVRPLAPQEAGGTAWTGRPAAHFELRPLSLGEVLDRTFALYRSQFWLFAAIAMIAAAVNVVGQGISLANAHRMAGRMILAPGSSPAAALMNLRAVGSAQLGAYAVMAVFLLVSAITQAGTALAVTQVYLNKPAHAKEAMLAVLPRWYRWIGIALWQAWSLLWVMLAVLVPAGLLLAVGVRTHATVLLVIGGFLALVAILGGFPAGVILYLRNALATPAAVIEGLRVRQAMRRSKVLAAGAKGRVFVVLLIAFCLLEVVAVLISPVSMLMVMSPNQEHFLARGIGLLIVFVGHTVVAPVALIGLTLVYFDQRVRKEALDLELLLEHARDPETVVGRRRPEVSSPERYAPLP